MEHNHPSAVELKIVRLETRVDRIEDDIREEQQSRTGMIRELKEELVHVKNHLNNQDKVLNKMIGALIVINIIWPLAVRKLFN